MNNLAATFLGATIVKIVKGLCSGEALVNNSHYSGMRCESRTSTVSMDLCPMFSGVSVVQSVRLNSLLSLVGFSDFWLRCWASERVGFSVQGSIRGMKNGPFLSK